MIQEKHFNYYFTKNEKSRSQKPPVTKAILFYICKLVKAVERLTGSNDLSQTLCDHQKPYSVQNLMNIMEMKLFGDDLKVEVDIWELFDKYTISGFPLAEKIFF